MHTAARSQGRRPVGKGLPPDLGPVERRPQAVLVSQVAALMASTLGVDMVMTGHSLGRNKLEHLLASGAP